MLKDAIARLKRRVNVSNVLKSGDNEPDLKALASKATTLLDAGSIAADTDKIKEWAIAQGVDEESATNFASDVVDAYFDDTSDEIQKSENGSDEDEEEEKKKEQFKKKDKEDEREEIEKAQISFIFNVQNALEVLKSNQETLAAAIEHLLDRSEENTKFKDEFQKLKSELGELSKRPANEKTPVTSNVQKSNLDSKIQGQVAPQDRDKFSKIIIKGIEQGLCFIEDISFLEARGQLTDRASKFISDYKEVQK
ncbi:hypothetical protein FH581_023000 (plasmid) [Leptospira weilii]|uniref:hypothetical protein n=1 Tax=Leptospira weilii TaxID=28184 RepID=UPI0007749050|nr:hypothetical protein [Leptospira weilii]UPY81124.1 hypothetical protein FH581_023000 [Leptospira weilii]